MSVQRMNRPGVEIQQEFATQTPSVSAAPLLPTVVIGVNVQSVTAASAGDYTGTSLVFAYPNLEFGAVVDLTSVSVTLKNVRLQVAARATADTTFASDIATSAASNFVTAGVAQNDLFVATSGIITYTAKVLAVVSATELKLDRYLPFSTASFKVLRASADLQVAASDVTAAAGNVTVASGLTVSSLPIASANTFVTYDAVRTATQGALTEITQAAEVEGKLMKPSIKNKLALGVQIAKGNSGTTPVYALAIPDESPASYLNALDFLSNRQSAGTDDIYSIVMLTQDQTAVSLLKQHVEQMADPVRARFRTGIVNLAHPTESIVVQQTQSCSLARSSGVVTLAHPTAGFSGVVNVGDFAVLTARTTSPVTSVPARAGIYKVKAILSNGVLELDSKFYVGSDGSYAEGTSITADFTSDTLDFKILRVLDKAGQAQAIAETASSFGSRRIIYVTNATCTVTVGTTDVQVPGYYLAAALAGLSSGTQPHQGFTNLGLSGVKAVQYGNSYFKEDQMGLIAGSGGFLLEQRSPTAAPMAFYQTTTDTTTLEAKEYSITKTIDYFCIGLKAQLQKQIGIANIYAGTLAALANSVDAWHTYLKSRTFPLIGSPLIDAKLETLEQDPLQRDTVIIVDNITVPTPLNRIRVRVRVSV